MEIEYDSHIWVRWKLELEFLSFLFEKTTFEEYDSNYKYHKSETILNKRAGMSNEFTSRTT